VRPLSACVDTARIRIHAEHALPFSPVTVAGIGYHSGMRKRRINLIAVVLALLVCVTVIVWMVNDWPPPRLILKYGFPPTGGPTGNKRVIEGIEFVELKPGYFRMGSHYLCEEGDLLGWICAPFGLSWGIPPKHRNECPVHWVEFEEGFWIATTEVTNAQYERLVPEYERWLVLGDRDPVVEVSWEEAKRYCALLSEKSGLRIRLPSESEWECACRAGSKWEFCSGDDMKALERHAWFDGDLDQGVHEVGSRCENAWGLHDLHGSVWEWCEDTYHASYEDAPTDGSAWTRGGEEWEVGTPNRIIRGGSFANPAKYLRSACRYRTKPSPGGNRGFRPAFVLSEAE